MSAQDESSLQSTSTFARNEIEWMDDNASACCLICENMWSLKRRRHHCRNCGRLVCNDCSNHKVKLDDGDTELKRVCNDCVITLEEKKKIINDGVEWMPDNFSQGCVMCAEKWTMQNRRHHCRRCGRLVCKDCSMRTIKMEGDTEEKRACDECFETLELKKQVQMEANYQRERELALLNATSKVSDSLIRVYFLDGSFKTVFYDSSVTAADIIAKICFSVKIALFEVQRDIRNPSEYLLVPENECIGDITIRWERNNAENAKLVVPIYDVNSSLRGQAPPSLSNPSVSSLGLRAGPSDDMVSTSKLSTRKSFSGAPPSADQSGAYDTGTSTLETISEYSDQNISSATGGRQSSVAASTQPNKRGSFSSFFQSPAKEKEAKEQVRYRQSVDFDNDRDGGFDDMPMSRMSFSSNLFGGGGGGGGGGGMGPTSDMGSHWSRIQEQEIYTLRKDLAELRKKYDILRSIHVKNTKTERQRLKAEKDKVDDPRSGKQSGRHKAVGSSDNDSGSNENSNPRDSIDNEDQGNDSTKTGDDQGTTTTTAEGGDDDAVLFEGYLSRKNFFNKQSSLLYFILRKNRMLYYYNTPKLVSPDDLFDESVLCRYKKDNFTGKWNAKKCRVVIDKTEKNKIILSLTSKKVSLRAASAELANQWAVALDNKLAGIAGVGITGATKKPADYKQDRGGATSVFVEEDITTIMKQTSSERVKSFLDKVGETEIFFARFDEVLQTAFSEGVANPQQMFHVYEIIAAMQSLYSYVLHYGEQWTADTKGWLLGMLRQTMSLPIEEPEMLMAVIQCLTRENMLFAPETVNTVNQVIEMSFEEGHDNESQSSTIESVLNSVKRMVTTLDQVVEDLMPLLPEDFNIIKMFQERANIKIKNDIKTFYVTNKNNLNNRDLLTLLSFADSQLHILQKFGVDTSVVEGLNADLLKQYCTVTQNLMRQWMIRIHEADSKISDGDFDVEEGIGQSTPWPGDMSACVGEHIVLAYQELTSSAAEKVTLLMLEMLPEYTSMQNNWLQSIKKLSTTTPERVCAYINTHLRFSVILNERKLKLESAMEGNVKVSNAFNNASKVFVSESDRGLDVLQVLVSDDFRQGLVEGLFKEEWASENGIAIIDTLRATLVDYVADLKTWLTLESHVKKIIGTVMKTVNSCYLEMLLTFGVSVTGRVGDRLLQDVTAMTQAFLAFAPTMLLAEHIDREFKPLRDLVILLRMDLRQIAQFVRSELYTDFGAAAIKVFIHAMCMREETKQVQEAVLEAITKGWEPIAVKPLVEISYQIGLTSYIEACIHLGLG